MFQMVSFEQGKLIIYAIIVLAVALVVSIDSKREIKRLNEKYSDDSNPVIRNHPPFVSIIICIVLLAYSLIIPARMTDSKYEKLQEEYDALLDEKELADEKYYALSNSIDSVYDDVIYLKYYFLDDEDTDKETASNCSLHLYSVLFPDD